ncbi:MAG: DsbA family protein [Notoacmeibacter sp.]|nr:DsbA family protein [Notoacmeibacter sp.]MCC0031767.1 DsbA family protein [Brucellaceae bacterium]
MRFALLALAASTALGVAPARLAQAEALTITDENRAQIEAIIHDYLLNNPEVLAEAQKALEAKQEAAQKAAQKSLIAEAKDAIFTSEHDGIVGNPDGKVTIVEFFDYNCGYCKRAMADMDAMVAADKDLRFVLKEFPILGEDSQKAHVVAQAVQRMMPEKYGAFHRKLLSSKGRADEAKAIAIAVEMGADEKALREKMQDPSIMDSFRSAYELANKLSITGTPSYVVGDEVVFGALGREVLSAKIENLRSCNSTSC